ncbi:separase isoform X1 [Tanacetum coccineum]
MVESMRKPYYITDCKLLQETGGLGHRNLVIGLVIESSKLCCTIQWGRVSDFCKMLKLTKDGVSSGFSEYAIVDLVTKASLDSASLLSLFNKHRRAAELNTMLIELVGRWLDAKKNFAIPSPVALVHQWVDIQYEQTQRSTIYSLVQSLRTSNQSGGIILEQELNEYRKIKDRNPELCKEMEILIENTISETNRRIYGLSRSDSLIKCGARLASCGPISCQSDSITYLDQAISILEFTEDIKNALKAWDHRSASHDKIKLRDNDIDLFFHVADLLALEGYRELNSKLYKMMIKRVKLAENRELSDFLEMAWKSGSLSHALCASPVDVLIIKEMEDTNVQFWINCGKTQEQKAGIKQCLSVIPTLSSDDLRDDAHAQEAQKTIYEVKEAISTLINEESHSFDSFGAARLHYDLAERFIAKGLFIEAHSHATKSYLLRDKHLSECFDIEWHRGKANIVGQADTKITKYDCPSLISNPSSILPFAYSGPQTYPTPWSTVRCYLESSLQTGIVQEKIGNGDEAEIFFLRGQKIATVLHLPMFIARFSRALGKIYLKKGLWILALKNLKDAREHDCSSISCLKCTLVSEVALNVQLGDIYLIRNPLK